MCPAKKPIQIETEKKADDMLDIHWTHITLHTNLSVMGLGTSKTINAVQHKCTHYNTGIVTSARKPVSAPIHSACSNCAHDHALVCDSCQACKIVYKGLGCTWHWPACCYSSSNTDAPAQSKKNHRDGKKWCRHNQGCGGKNHTNAINVHQWWLWLSDGWDQYGCVTLNIHLPISIPDFETAEVALSTHPQVSAPDSEIAQINDIMITVMTEVFITIDFLQALVQAIMESYVVRLRSVQEEMPCYSMFSRNYFWTALMCKATSLLPIQTSLTTYNGTH